MNFKNTKKRQVNINKVVISMYLLLIFIFMFLWSYKTPFVTDDLFFYHEKIIMPSIDDYFQTNGRIFGQIFTRFILSRSLVFSSICTASAFTLLIYILIKLTNSYTNNYLSIERIILITTAIFLFTPGFASVFIWRAGVGNYLITSVVEFLFILNIYKCSSHNKIDLLVIVILGFVAGLGNENTSGGILLICILFIIKKYILDNHIPSSLICGTISLVLGYLILMLSPGSRKRAEVNEYAYLKLPFVRRLFEGLTRQISFLYMEKWPIVYLSLITILIVAAFVFWKKNPRFLDGLIFISGGLASGLILIASPEGMDIGRTYLGPTLLILVGAMLLIPLRIKEKGIKTVYISTISVLTLVCIFNIVIGIQVSREFNSQLSARYNYISQKNSSVVKVTPIKQEGYNKYSLSPIYWEVKKNSEVFPNNQYYKFFKKKVKLEN